MFDQAFTRHAALAGEPERLPRSAHRIALASRRQERREQPGVRTRG